LKGGVLGWNDPSVYVPEFREALSKHSQTNDTANRCQNCTRLALNTILERPVIDDATEKRKEDRAYPIIIFNRKQFN